MKKSMIQTIASVLLVSMLCSSAYAVSEDDLKYYLKEALLDWYESRDPGNEIIPADQTRDLLLYYLLVPEDENPVVSFSTAVGSESGQPIQYIFGDAVLNLTEREGGLPTAPCVLGWACITPFHRANIMSDSPCDWTGRMLCQYSCSGSTCETAP